MRTPASPARGQRTVEVLEIAAAAFTGLVALGSFLGSLALVRNARRWRRTLARRLADDGAALRPAAGPRVALVIPARGEPGALEANMRALLAQDVGPMETVIVVDTRGEALFAACEQWAREAPAAHARVVAVEDVPGPLARAGKCAALLRGMREVSATAEVLAFADDDVRPGPGWLGDLVAPLADPGVCVATGYRWYFSRGAGLATHTRSAWNLVGLSIMFSDTYNFAWGGGMALRRADFEAWGVATGWERAISDDYVVTVAAKKDKRPIRFVPAALVPSHEPVSTRALFEWCRRQSFMTKIYDPRLWRFAVVPYVFFNATMLLGAAGLVAAALGVAVPLWALVASVLFASHFPLNAVKNLVFYGGVLEMMPAHRDELRASRAAFLAGSMLAPFVMIYALWATRNLRLIEWRGKRYEVQGPMDVRPL